MTLMSLVMVLVGAVFTIIPFQAFYTNYGLRREHLGSHRKHLLFSLFPMAIFALCIITIIEMPENPDEFDRKMSVAAGHGIASMILTTLICRLRWLFSKRPIDMTVEDCLRRQWPSIESIDDEVSENHDNLQRMVDMTSKNPSMHAKFFLLPPHLPFTAIVAVYLDYLDALGHTNQPLGSIGRELEKDDPLPCKEARFITKSLDGTSEFHYVAYTEEVGMLFIASSDVDWTHDMV